jgi:hypothetical protein
VRGTWEAFQTSPERFDQTLLVSNLLIGAGQQSAINSMDWAADT